VSAEIRPADYFVAGGTLKPDTPSYVTRPADDELFDLVLSGEFCYVLTPRQMGKSSLMVRTAQRLRECQVRTAIIDLTQIGTEISDERWYLSLLSQLKRRLQLSVDPVAWWQARTDLASVLRFTDFLRDVVLVEVPDRIVIFIDEIDTTLSLDFRDDFFAAIRAVYNERAAAPEFERLTFVLLGVASPPELIKDQARTPFNIGHAIALQEFSWADSAVLREGLDAVLPGQGNAIFGKIYHWTSGHPYLTQKICLTMAESGDENASAERVDGLVEELFLSEEARRETNLQFVRNKILANPQSGELLALYKDIVRGRKVQDDGQSVVQNQLRLSGLVKVENGILQTRNEIYRRAFNHEWVSRHTAINWAPIVAGAAVLVALLAVGLLSFNLWVINQCNSYGHDVLLPTSSAETRLTKLAQAFRLPKPLFGSSTCAHEAPEWFYGLSGEEQIALFQASKEETEDLTVVIRNIYVICSDRITKIHFKHIWIRLKNIRKQWLCVLITRLYATKERGCISGWHNQGNHHNLQATTISL
jgi:hypothetical protein